MPTLKVRINPQTGRSYAHLVLLISILLLLSISCLNTSFVSVKANDPRIGVAIPENGQIVDQTEISPEILTIYFEFFLDIPEGSEATITVRWYYQDKILHSYSGKHPRGLNVVTLERDASIMPVFKVGWYKAEVWFLNTLILSDKFEVVE